MELTVKERILLADILPGSGDISTIRISNDLRNDLSFSEEEHDIYGFRSPEENPNAIFWDMDAPQEKDIEIGKKASKLIEDALKKLDENGGVTVDHISLFDKFMEVEE